MPNEIVGEIPEFTTEEAGSEPKEEVIKSDVGEETPDVPEGTETPPELPAEEKPVEVAESQPADEDTEVKELDSLRATVNEAVEKATVGLRGEIVTLREKLSDARSIAEKRTIEKRIDTVKENIDELTDLNPEDVTVVDRILRSKGYITKKESESMFYDSVKREKLAEFLEKFPEYKPENDPSDSKWANLQAEVGLYKMPDDPYFITRILERAHRAISKTSSDPSIPIKKQQVKTAGVGSGGVQRSSSKGRLDSHRRQLLEQGGWSEEEIQSIEKNLSE